MKRFDLFIVVVLMTFDVWAQNIHTLIFADTNDAKIGEGVQQNVRIFTEFTFDVASALGWADALDGPHIYIGNDCSKAKLTSVLNNFSCGSDDIVIFGYFGHGVRSKDDQSEFPQMCLGSNISSDFVPLEDIKDYFVHAGARFVFVMGDCCNSYAGIGAKRGVLAAGGPTILSSDNALVIKKLFGMKGSVIASGSQKGEYSWINSVSGGFFTNGFLDELDKYLGDNPSNPDWNALFTNVQSNVVNYSRERLKDQGGYVQTPIWKVEEGGNPKIVERHRTIIDDGTIRSQLLKLVDKTVEDQHRIELIPNVRKHFASGAMVEIYGKDETTLLGVKTIDEYLQTIAVSPFLANFIIIKDVKDNSGKITKLSIHEIYVHN